jgi:hypothetical protein
MGLCTVQHFDPESQTWKRKNQVTWDVVISRPYHKCNRTMLKLGTKDQKSHFSILYRALLADSFYSHADRGICSTLQLLSRPGLLSIKNNSFQVCNNFDDKLTGSRKDTDFIWRTKELYSQLAHFRDKFEKTMLNTYNMPYWPKSNSRYSPTLASENPTAISNLHVENAFCCGVALSEFYTCNISSESQKGLGGKRKCPYFHSLQV